MRKISIYSPRQLTIWQLLPPYPVEQIQLWVESLLTIQYPLFWHGLVAHRSKLTKNYSRISTHYSLCSQNWPVYPFWQEHL